MNDRKVYNKLKCLQCNSETAFLYIFQYVMNGDIWNQQFGLDILKIMLGLFSVLEEDWKENYIFHWTESLMTLYFQI